MLLYTLNACHLENSLHNNTLQLDEWLTFHPTTDGTWGKCNGFSIRTWLVQKPYCIRVPLQLWPWHKVTKDVQAVPYSFMHQLYIQRMFLAGQHSEWSIIVLFSALVWVTCLLMISQAEPGVVCLSENSENLKWLWSSSKKLSSIKLWGDSSGTINRQQIIAHITAWG